MFTTKTYIDFFDYILFQTIKESLGSMKEIKLENDVPKSGKERRVLRLYHKSSESKAIIFVATGI